MEYPIAVFAYNRPKHLQACLEAIDRSQKHSGLLFPLYIYCDAPHKEQERAHVAETLDVAYGWSGKKEVIVREKNYGFHNIVEGVSELCNRYGEVIVIEDDILISPDFLSFMHQGLTQYAQDERVFGVTGYMYFDAQPATPEVFFQRYAFCWGWATWQRAWKYFDWNPDGWQEYLSNRKNRRRYNCFGTFPFAKMAEKAFTGKWNTWDCQWGFSVFKNEGLFLTPYRSLIWNCGCGGGTHGDQKKDSDIELGEREPYIHGTMKREDFHKPRLSAHFSLPSRVACDQKAMRLLAMTLLKFRLHREPHKRLSLCLNFLYQYLRALFGLRPNLTRRGH